MKTILSEIKTSIIATIALAIILSGLYPVVVWGLAQLTFPHRANGSLIESNDRRIIGSDLLGQSFSGEKYFHPRPSAAGSGYDALSSSGTNLGPTSQKLINNVQAAVEQYRKENNLSADVLIPGDAVTSSGSGLDPHISVGNAQLQTPRVAKARGLSEENVRDFVRQNTEGPQLGILGDAGVNVLKLNLALDQAR
jgi:K+-transporting ATPase ATPase C chain